MKPARNITRSDVAILLVLIAIVLCNVAAIGTTGRNRAKEIVCQANLRQWHAVFHQYLADNDGEFFTGTPPTGYWWPAQLNEATQSWKKNRTWFCPAAARPLYDEEGRGYWHITDARAWGVFTAPNLLGPDGIAGSYGLNGYTIDIPLSDRYESRYEGGVSADDGWRDLANIAQGETIPLFLDALRFDLWPLETDAPVENLYAAWVGSSMARCCINRHGGGVNCLFLDGSARKVGLKELWTLKWHKSFNTAGPWTQAGGVTTADWPEWMHDFKDY